jgi:hypothetical protein
LFVQITAAASIGYQASSEGVLTPWVDRRQRMAGRKRCELFHARVVEVAPADQDRTNTLL